MEELNLLRQWPNFHWGFASAASVLSMNTRVDALSWFDLLLSRDSRVFSGITVDISSFNKPSLQYSSHIHACDWENTALFYGTLAK